ncbi:MAG: Sulfate adenylyltransferase subunit 1 [Deltaproteobacteria bacterium]|nr:Sulfate adenylyltransferase subunit 1 [Deltaproteobacteria bacterium]
MAAYLPRFRKMVDARANKKLEVRRFDVSDRPLSPKKATELKLNDLGRTQLRTTTPLVYDAYRRNRTTGAFILVDETTNSTVAAGMLLAE